MSNEHNPEPERKVHRTTATQAVVEYAGKHKKPITAQCGVIFVPRWWLRESLNQLEKCPQCFPDRAWAA